MAATQQSNKQEKNLVHLNERWASRVKREKDAAKEWQRMLHIFFASIYKLVFVYHHVGVSFLISHS